MRYVDRLIGDYLEKYKQHIYTRKEKEAGGEDIAAEDICEENRNRQETAGGMDQWTPADLKLLPMAACKKLAQMFNAIEKTEQLGQRRVHLQEQHSWRRKRPSISIIISCVVDASSILQAICKDHIEACSHGSKDG